MVVVVMVMVMVVVVVVVVVIVSKRRRRCYRRCHDRGHPHRRAAYSEGVAVRRARRPSRETATMPMAVVSSLGRSSREAPVDEGTMVCPLHQQRPWARVRACVRVGVQCSALQCSAALTVR